jgi:hypothetical protein
VHIFLETTLEITEGANKKKEDDKQSKNTKNKESVEHHCVQANTNNENKT